MCENKINAIKTRLKLVISKRNISINQLAMDSDVSDACIINWFSKRNYVPRLDTLLKICETLNIDLYDILIDHDKTALYPLNKDESFLYSKWKSLTLKQKESLINLVKNFDK